MTVTSLSSSLTPDQGLLLCGTVKTALRAAGLDRPDSMLRGGELAGLIAPNVYGSTGFSVTQRPATESCPQTHLEFNVVIDGKLAGLNYREYDEWQEDDSIRLHEPTDEHRLYDRIKQVFTALGWDVIDVRYSGCQMHWDYDVEYSVRCQPQPQAALAHARSLTAA